MTLNWNYSNEEAILELDNLRIEISDLALELRNIRKYHGRTTPQIEGKMDNLLRRQSDVNKWLEAAFNPREDHHE